MTNIALILAVGVLGIGVMPFERKMLTRDCVVMLLVYVLCAVLFALPLNYAGKTLNGIDYRGGIVLLLCCAGYMTLLFRQKRIETGSVMQQKPTGIQIAREFLLLALGIVMITVGSKGMVDPVTWGAQKLGISMLVISSTIVAFGTSVPELAVTIAGIVKKKHDIALGNIIGSNIFNILLIFGFTSCIYPLPLDTKGLGVCNLVAMGFTAVVLVLFMAMGKTALKRRHGLVLLLLYIVFMICNGIAAK